MTPSMPSHFLPVGLISSMRATSSTRATWLLLDGHRRSGVIGHDLRVYYGTVRLIDDQVGRVLDALDESGRADDTIVIFTADHGEMASGHGMVWKSTSAFYDEIA